MALFSNLLTTPSLIFFVTALAAVLGLGIWWLRRQRQVRIWLPTVRILDLETRVLPRLLLRPPPLVMFLAFFATAAALIMMTLRPRLQVFTPFEPNRAQLHLFVDMSPSVAAHLRLEAYAQRVGELWASLKDQGRISVSTSHDATIFEPQNQTELQDYLSKKGFQRVGLRLGNLLKTQLDAAGPINRLFIVADRDQHTWSGFNWSYLLSDMEILHVDLAADGPKRNVFISEARYLAAPGADSMDWDVDIARSLTKERPEQRVGGTALAALSGTLSVAYLGEVLAKVDWLLPAGAERVVVHINWPEAKIAAAWRPDGNSTSPRLAGAAPDLTAEAPLLWQLEVANGEDNALAFDDVFRTSVHGVRQDILLISESAGERPLEDPAHQLEIALQVLGFRVKRHDFIEQPGPAATAYPLWIIVGGAGQGQRRRERAGRQQNDLADHFCPRSLEQLRLATHRHPGRQAKQSPTSDRRGPHVWLIPFQVNADYEELCGCYARLLLTQDEHDATPSFCEQISSRSTWATLLPSLGAKQIGGELGDQAASLAWLGQDTAMNSGLSVLAFTVPLTPLQATGITHAQLPLLVKELLVWQGLLANGSGTNGAWPRFDDLAALLKPPMVAQAEPALAASGDMAAILSPELRLKIKQSNVPLAESLMAELPASALPPRWSPQLAAAGEALPAKKEREDPLPWLAWLTGIAIAAAAFEMVWILASRLFKTVRQAKAAGVKPWDQPAQREGL